jgi:hypothetical protein
VKEGGRPLDSGNYERGSYHHVVDTLSLICVQIDIMEWGDNYAIPLNIHAVIKTELCQLGVSIGGFCKTLTCWAGQPSSQCILEPCLRSVEAY